MESSAILELFARLDAIRMTESERTVAKDCVRRGERYGAVPERIGQWLRSNAAPRAGRPAPRTIASPD